MPWDKTSSSSDWIMGLIILATVGLDNVPDDIEEIALGEGELLGGSRTVVAEGPNDLFGRNYSRDWLAESWEGLGAVGDWASVCTHRPAETQRLHSD